MSALHPQDIISKLVKRLEALEEQRETSRQEYMREIHTLREELADLKEQPVKPVRQTIPRPSGEANRSGRKGGQSGRKGFNVKEAVHAVNPDMSWTKFTVFFFTIDCFTCPS